MQNRFVLKADSGEGGSVLWVANVLLFLGLNAQKRHSIRIGPCTTHGERNSIK